MVPSGLHFLSHLYYQCPVSYLHLAFQSHPNYFRLLVIIIIYSFYLSTSIFSYSTTLPSDFCCYLTTACCLTLFLSLCENIFHTSSLYEFPGEMPINFYPTQIDYCWQTKETVPPKPSVVSQWVYWGYLQDHDSLKGHYISGKTRHIMNDSSWNLKSWISLYPLQSSPWKSLFSPDILL